MTAANMDLFEAYFRRADLDHDGRISGQEAVAFFQGSNLSKQVLAQVWMHADQNRTGFLGRAAFYNALKLVTVAQNGHELTPDMVKAALHGPASAKIPAPQINYSPASTNFTPPTLQANSVGRPTGPMNVVAPSLHMATARPPLHNQISSGIQPMQSTGFPQPQNVVLNQQFPRPLDNQFVRSQGVQSSLLPTQGIGQGAPIPGNIPGSQIPNSNSSPDLIGSRMGGSSAGISAQVLNKVGTMSIPSVGSVGQVSSASTPSIPAKSAPDISLSALSVNKDPKGLLAGNGFPSSSMFGAELFSVITSQSNPSSAVSMANILNPSAIVPVSNAAQPPPKQGPSMILNNSASTLSSGQFQQTSPLVKPDQFVASNGVLTSTVSGVSTVVGPMTSQGQPPWPRITQSDIQRYNAIFVEVDTDRDGKITGEQARHLFLSWKLPREVLKQVWDLSDQDNDSMLSLKEFCAALYLMERYREGRPLPAVLPSSLKFDESLLPVAGQSTGFGGSTWRSTHGFPQHMVSGVHSAVPSTGLRPTSGHQILPSDDARGTQTVQQRPGVPVLEKQHFNQLGLEGQPALSSKFQETTESEKKVEGMEKEVLDFKEKMEFYRTTMQELVLYKSRCDNRLNEITARASADRSEVETLTKKYEERYKQVSEIASKLTVDEASFRDIQERKLELYNAIVKMEQGGSADGLLQVRADQIHSDLEGLVKALSERCKHYSLQLKQSALVEIPYGWQPGIQNGAADWDDDWDKLEGEGFVVVQELTVEEEKVDRKPKPSSVWNEKSISNDEFSRAVLSDVHNSVEKLSNTDQHTVEDESVHAQSEDEAANDDPLTAVRSALSSPRELSSPHFDKTNHLDSFSNAKESHSPREFPVTHYDAIIGVDSPVKAKEACGDDVAESTLSADKFDEPSWGAAFSDVNDDMDSVWGFNTISSKDHESSHVKHDNGLFGADDWGLNPIRTGSPSAGSLFGTKESNSFFFGDSVPGTPFTNSPGHGKGFDDHSFRNRFMSFDSFNMNHNNSSPRNDATLARFDSMRSTTTDFNHSHGFLAFDDTDLFRTTGPFKSDKSTSKQTSDGWKAF